MRPIRRMPGNLAYARASAPWTHSLWLCAERCPTNATYVPLPPMHPAKLSMRWAPKAGLSNGSMSTSVFRWLLACG